MSTKVEQAVTALQSLPADRRDELAQVIIDAAIPTIEWSPELHAAVEEGIADADAGRFADPEDVQAVFDRHR